MKYISTRGRAPALLFDEVLLAGLARDGGLYVPEAWPRLARAEVRALRGLPYAELAARVMLPFVGGRISDTDFTAIVADAYAGFGHPAVAPLRQIGGNHWLLELFHGPTLSFKDYALQVVGRLFDHVLAKRGQRITIVAATSGDTGSAAIEACRDRDSIDIFVLHPKGRISAVQRRQMTTVQAPNVHNIALQGTFDDCQDLVKALFNDPAFRDRFRLSAVNSINWARIMAQTVFYFAAGVALGAPDRSLNFAVPTGNFGNVFAAYVAHRMGLSANRLIVASNANDVLTRFFDSGTMETAKVMRTLSPSMDLQISSNFERLLFDSYGRDGPRLADVVGTFRETGSLAVGKARWRRMRRLFEGHRLDDEATKAAIRGIHDATGELVDPHTAIGIAAGRAAGRLAPDSALVSMATAHAAKFPAAVKAATGIQPAMPERLADLHLRPERYQVLPNEVGAVRDFVEGRLAKRPAA